MEIETDGKGEREREWKDINTQNLVKNIVIRIGTMGERERKRDYNHSCITGGGNANGSDRMPETAAAAAILSPQPEYIRINATILC